MGKISITKETMAKMIDHTILKAVATKKDVKKLCDEAKKYGFMSVCVNPYFTEFAAEQLKGSNVKVCTVVGFPLGASATAIKALEARHAVRLGSQEIDMVINIGALKEKKYNRVLEDISEVVEASGKSIVKVILETCYLTDDEIIKACKLSVEAGADFVKTSTGFGTAGAKTEHIKMMRKTVGRDVGVKASGGIRDLETAEAMIKAGASRIGASAGIAILEEMK